MFFLSEMLNNRLHLPKAGDALPGRTRPIRTASRHHVSKRPLNGPYPAGAEVAAFSMGRFAAAEKLFWERPGVWVTAAGYAGGATPNPTHQEVCTGLTGHAETVRVVFEPAILSYAELLALFWENHDPTQGMRQGGDVGTTYRSAIHTLTADQQSAALASRDVYQAALEASGFSAAITTEIAGNDAFYFAEAEHQQYPARNPGSHFELKGTGVRFPAPPVGA